MATMVSEKEATHGSKTDNPGVSSALKPQDGDLETPSGGQHTEETEGTQAAIPPIAKAPGIEAVRMPAEVESGALGDDYLMAERSTKHDISVTRRRYRRL